MPVQRSEPTFLDPSKPNVSRQPDVVRCQKCGCEWMELICVQQYAKHHNVILGQRPGSISDIGFWLFRCPKCQEIQEPALTYGGFQDIGRKGYNKFLDQMDKKDTSNGEDI
jgi:hypothetical protein